MNFLPVDENKDSQQRLKYTQSFVLPDQINFNHLTRDSNSQYMGIAENKNVNGDKKFNNNSPINPIQSNPNNSFHKTRENIDNYINRKSSKNIEQSYHPIVNQSIVQINTDIQKNKPQQQLIQSKTHPRNNIQQSAVNIVLQNNVKKNQPIVSSKSKHIIEGIHPIIEQQHQNISMEVQPEIHQQYTTIIIPPADQSHLNTSHRQHKPDLFNEIIQQLSPNHTIIQSKHHQDSNFDIKKQIINQSFELNKPQDPLYISINSNHGLNHSNNTLNQQAAILKPPHTNQEEYYNIKITQIRNRQNKESGHHQTILEDPLQFPSEQLDDHFNKNLRLSEHTQTLTRSIKPIPQKRQLKSLTPNSSELGQSSKMSDVNAPLLNKASQFMNGVQGWNPDKKIFNVFKIPLNNTPPISFSKARINTASIKP